MHLAPRRKRLFAAFGAAILCSVFAYYLSDLGTNPPGFFLDESFIAYNAYVLSQTGHGEYGDFLPLFFPSFQREDYSFVAYANPVFIYVLAIVFLGVGPSIVAAKALGAVLVFAACLVLGWIAYRMTDSVFVGFFIAISAALSPWFYELSRLVFEVTAYPLSLLLFLLAVYRCWRSDRWNFLNTAMVAGGLALVTYSYTIGRLVGPMLAAGLVIFYGRRRLWPLARTVGMYLIALVPLLVFAQRRPGALTGRFNEVSNLGEDGGRNVFQTILSFVTSYFIDIGPSALLLVGDPQERHHIPAMGMIFVATFLTAAAGLFVALRRPTNRWYLYLLFGLAISAIPGALTNDRAHMLRLATLPVFIFLVSVPAIKWLLKNARINASTSTVGAPSRLPRPLSLAAIAVLCLSIVFQAYYFHSRYDEFRDIRGYLFDAAYPSVFAKAVAEPSRPIYLEQPDNYPAYIHARWYGATVGIAPIAFAKLVPGERAPANSIVISMSSECQDCQIIARQGAFMVYRTATITGQ